MPFATPLRIYNCNDDGRALVSKAIRMILLYTETGHFLHKCTIITDFTLDTHHLGTESSFLPHFVNEYNFVSRNMDFGVMEDADDDTGYYFNEPPERDIGPDTSRDVIQRDLRQMANDYTKTNLGAEMNKMRKLENIYALTGNSEVGSKLKEVEAYKATIKEKKMMLDELVITNAKLQFENRKKGPLAITDGSGIDMDAVNDQNIDVKLLEMEKRIMEARRVIESRGTDDGLIEALQNYHDVFKQTMESMENITRGRPPRTMPKITSFRQFIEDSERSLIPDDKRDPEVSKALKELKLLNKYDSLSPNKLPYMPGLPYNFEEEIAHLDLMSNDILDDVGVPDDIVEIPLSTFLEHVPDVKPAKSIMKKIEATDKKKKSKTKLKKCAERVKFQHDEIK